MPSPPEVEWDHNYNCPKENFRKVSFALPSSSSSAPPPPPPKNPLLEMATAPPGSASALPPAPSSRKRKYSVCPHCGMPKPTHDAWACPKYRKCANCRRRAHDTEGCRYPSVTPEMMVAGRDECDVCGELGHVEENCGGMWKAAQPALEKGKGKEGKERVAGVRSCFYCASSEHWGDDCEERKAAMRKGDVEPNWPGTWWYGEKKEDVEMEEGKGEQSPPPPKGRNFQMGMFDDMRDF